MADGMIRSIARMVREAHYFVFRAPQGLGRRKPRSEWNEQYRSGRWEYLDSASELAHYMVIVGYIQHFFAAPAVLDVGCGHGRLYQLLRWYPIASYLGIDVSAEGIRRAHHLASPRAQFVEADFEQFQPSQRYDAIVFNESIYFAPEPAAMLRRYSAALTTDGVFIVSMCHNRWQFPIWSALERDATLLNATAVTNEKGQTWHVRAFRPR